MLQSKTKLQELRSSRKCIQKFYSLCIYIYIIKYEVSSRVGASPEVKQVESIHALQTIDNSGSTNSCIGLVCRVGCKSYYNWKSYSVVPLILSNYIRFAANSTGLRSKKHDILTSVTILRQMNYVWTKAEAAHTPNPSVWMSI